MGVSVYWPLSVLCAFVYVCVCLCVCDIKSEYQKKIQVLDLSKLDALLHKTHIKVLVVLTYQGLAYVDV